MSAGERPCAWCGEELYAGQRAFVVEDGGCIHPECLAAYLADAMDPAYLAALCGYEEVIL